MITSTDHTPAAIEQELSVLWAAHKAVGLDGYMCLYSLSEQAPFRSRQPGIAFWFGPDDTQAALAHILNHYNNGHLPNTTLLLNPIVHRRNDDDTYTPLGSGFIWSTSLCLGISVLSDDASERIWELGVHASAFHRGDNERAGLKMVAFCDEIQPALADGKTVAGCKELYELVNLKSDAYMGYYLLSGIAYLTNNGLFCHPDFTQLFPHRALAGDGDVSRLVQEGSIHAGRILDAAYCWNAYERHHSLYRKFGASPDDVQRNLGFFNLVARDIDLFDATGPARKDAEDMFEFIVPGLVPRGSITMLAGSGGVGKSSLAHHLCVMAAIDYEPGEEAPLWLGQRVAIEKCKGICVYFSGEDGPAIINARASMFDPEGRAKRLMFQRAEFGEGVSFKEHLRRLHKIADVPIMVIDPARKFLSGDEEDSGAVSEFFDAIEEFAVKKNTAVIIVHHLQKGASPKSAAEIADAIRGSQVFIDRSRVIIGMRRDGANTIVGLAKNNIPPNLGMVTEERVFARDAARLQLTWLPDRAHAHKPE